MNDCVYDSYEQMIGSGKILKPHIPSSGLLTTFQDCFNELTFCHITDFSIPTKVDKTGARKRTLPIRASTIKDKI